jgi:hypothetical protein
VALVAVARKLLLYCYSRLKNRRWYRDQIQLFFGGYKRYSSIILLAVHGLAIGRVYLSKCHELERVKDNMEREIAEITRFYMGALDRAFSRMDVALPPS